MAYISVSNSFVNGNTSDASAVNTNFTDIINGLSNGSKDLNMNAATFAGTLTANGAVVLGDAAGDVITVTGTATFTQNITASGGLTGNVTGNCSGTAASFTGNLSGDVTSVGMATTIGSGKIVDSMVNASANIADTKLATISTAGKVSNSATTATSANTVSAIVARDASGNFSAGTITAALSGNVTGNVTGNLTGNVTGNCSGTAATFTGNLTGDVTSVGMATTLASSIGGTHIFTGRAAIAAAALSTTADLLVGDSTATTQIGTIQRGIKNSTTIGRAATVEAGGFYCAATTENFAFTVPLFTNYYAGNTTKGAASTITNYVSFYGAMPAQGTYNAWASDNSSFASNYVLNFSSTNPSVFSGPVGIGGSNDTKAILQIGASNPLTGTTQVGAWSNTSFTSACTNGAAGIRVDVTTANSSFTVPSLSGLNIATVTKGASATVTNAYGIFVAAPSVGGTGNAAIADAIPTGNYYIYSTSTNPSILSGPTGIGGANSTSAVLNLGATNPLTGTTQIGLRVGDMTATSAATVEADAIVGIMRVANASFTLPVLSHFRSVPLAKGASATVTRAIGFFQDGDMTTVSAGNSATFADNKTFTGNYFIHSTSTNPSQFSGLVGVKQATDNVTDAGPTQAEMVTALGAANTLTGGIGVIKDANADTNFFLCITNGTSWYYLKMTKGA